MGKELQTERVRCLKDGTRASGDVYNTGDTIQGLTPKQAAKLVALGRGAQINTAKRGTRKATDSDTGSDDANRSDNDGE